VTDRDVRIGSRGSKLAIAQATIVQDALRAGGCEASIVVIETEGDRRAPDTAWGEGAFVAAIERALLNGRVDLAVHSAKDVPTEEDSRLLIVAYLPRADARDALVLPDRAIRRGLHDLAAGSRVGTDSPRRTAFVRARRPDLVVHPLNGNVDTRLRRLDAGETDALVLACAGLDRLGLSGRIAERLPAELIPPAPGQGAIAIQVRADDTRLVALAGSIDHPPTRAAVEAERAFLRASGGGCRAPIGAFAVSAFGAIDLLGGYASADGARVAFSRQSGPADDPATLGRRLAVDLHLDAGALRALVANGPSPRVLVTRSAAQARELRDSIAAVGLEPVLVPAVEIEIDGRGGELDRAAGSLHTYDWAVVTSPNGARAILVAAERILTELGIPRWAALGDSTAAVLEREGVAVTFRPSHPDAETLGAELPIAGGDHVVVLRADLAGDSLAAAIRRRGAVVDDVVAYRTSEAPEASRRALRQAVDAGRIAAIVFTSASTIRGLQALAAAESIEVTAIPAVCIGDPTARAARESGFHVLAVAPRPDPASIAESVAAALSPSLQEVS